MLTFDEALAAAAEMAEAARGLAHATLDFDHPEQTHEVIGDLHGSVHASKQVLTQLASTHERLSNRATDDAKNPAAGTRDANTAATELRQAAAFIGQAERHLDTASATAGQIVWHAEPVPQAQRDHINVVFLQGAEADRILDTITLQGADAAIEELAGHDYGDETVDAALENGYTYDEPPVGSLDKSARRGIYTLVYNPFMGHVGLYRERDRPPDPVLLALEDPPRHRVRETPAPSPVQAGPVHAEQVPALSRRERLGTPTVDRPAHVKHPAVRGLAL